MLLTIYTVRVYVVIVAPYKINKGGKLPPKALSYYC